MVAPLTAQQTLDRARSLLQAGRGAALPELLKIIETLSRNECEGTLSELADLIARDAVVLAKIISVANTLAHNPGIAPLSTLSQAIHQLGYHRIRTIAVSLMLLDTAGGANAAEQREAAAHALCAGLIAQGAAEWLGTHDPEFAFACTALRNFGRIIFAAVSAEHCRQAVQQAALLGEPAAYRAQFGLTPLDFTRQLLSAARLPEEVLRTLRECEPEALAGVATTHDARLLGIVDFGSRLASLTLDAQAGSDTFVTELQTLAQRFERLVPGAGDLAKPALQRTDERLRSISRCPGVRPLPAPSLNRIRRRLEQLTPAAEPPGRAIAPPPPPATPAALVPPALSAPCLPELPASSPIAAAWSLPRTDAIAFESNLRAPSPADPLHEALTLVRDALGGPECWLFCRSPAAESLALTHGLGPAWARLKPRALILAEERSVFGVCLTRREIVLIHDATDATLRPYLPPWFREPGLTPASFALIPLRAEGAPRGVLLIGWPAVRRIALSVAQLALVNQVFAAILPANAARAA